MAISSAAARFALPLSTFFDDTALPSGVAGPVERVHGFQARINAACRAFCSSVRTMQRQDAQPMPAKLPARLPLRVSGSFVPQAGHPLTGHP